MKVLVSICLSLSFLVLATPLSTFAKPAASSSPAFQLLPHSGPHSIINHTNKNLITFHLNIIGLKMDPTFINAKPKNVKGHGHVAIYLDKIPSDAFKTRDTTNILNSDAPTKCGKNVGKTCGKQGTYAYTVAPNAAWCKLHTGQHTLIFALAGNDSVLIHTPRNPKFALMVSYDKHGTK